MLKHMNLPAAQAFACAFLCLIMANTLLVQPSWAAKKRTPEIHTDLSILPERVKIMHDRILEAARSGDIQALHPVVEMNELKPTISFGGESDPIAYWKQTSGDGQGREILAILSEILEMPFARTDTGTSNEMYVWPYLAVLSPKKLTPAQQVDLYRLMSPEDVKTMKEAGDYIHYRLGLGRDGTWHFFVAGD